jgi:hypothetical protein
VVRLECYRTRKNPFRLGEPEPFGVFRPVSRTGAVFIATAAASALLSLRS